MSSLRLGPVVVDHTCTPDALGPGTGPGWVHIDIKNSANGSCTLVVNAIVSANPNVARTSQSVQTIDVPGRPRAQRKRLFAWFSITPFVAKKSIGKWEPVSQGGTEVSSSFTKETTPGLADSAGTVSDSVEVI